MSDSEITIHIPNGTLPTHVVFETPDGERWGTASGTFDHYDGTGTYRLVQLPNRREQLRDALTVAAKCHAKAQDELAKALEELEYTNTRLIAAARELLAYSKEER